MFIELDVEGRPRIFYRESGQGLPLVFLHGGWGYEIYPFDDQIREFEDRFRILIPDRSGYGRSPRLETFPRGFHRLAARESLAFLDALSIERAVLWGHSDGAVTAVLMGLEAPDRFPALVLEAIHYDRRKPRSKGFFETMASEPERFGEKVARVLSREHGEDYWRALLRMEGEAWLDIHEGWQDPERDLYGGRLGELRVPALIVHGSDDPRTEPDELEAIARQVPAARIRMIEGGGHSPHTVAAAEPNRAVHDFLAGAL